MISCIMLLLQLVLLC
ncbi:unnamed protein product [Larinioides sclopetarius]|uniref:Uncharacterized protein n=1 Tax=Larinioides sclopetarius TaxID=280406 RepID=A0AAV2BYW1_9ARAC